MRCCAGATARPTSPWRARSASARPPWHAALPTTFNYETLLEEAEDNPFLERFYRNRREAALATQLFFLFQRAQQMQELRQAELFSPVRVADFLIDKDPLFARINLDSDEYELYDKVFQKLTIDAPQPDLVIYLQAPRTCCWNVSNDAESPLNGISIAPILSS
jgi:hypothetical protein